VGDTQLLFEPFAYKRGFDQSRVADGDDRLLAESAQHVEVILLKAIFELFGDVEAPDRFAAAFKRHGDDRLDVVFPQRHRHIQFAPADMVDQPGPQLAGRPTGDGFRHSPLHFGCREITRSRQPPGSRLFAGQGEPAGIGFRHLYGQLHRGLGEAVEIEFGADRPAQGMQGRKLLDLAVEKMRRRQMENEGDVSH